MWDALAAGGAQPAGTQALEMFRLAAGIPRYGQDITERYLPQETDQQQALNFKKGCYIGQEIVERIHSRALLHRKLTGLEVDGAPPAPGAKIQQDGKEVGEITSALSVPGSQGDCTLALGYLRTEATAGNAELSVDGRARRRTPAALQGAGGMTTLLPVLCHPERGCAGRPAPAFGDAGWRRATESKYLLYLVNRLCLTRKNPSSP